jgi:predicted CXXCH cytochrome family protein
VVSLRFPRPARRTPGVEIDHDHSFSLPGLLIEGWDGRQAGCELRHSPAERPEVDIPSTLYEARPSGSAMARGKWLLLRLSASFAVGLAAAPAASAQVSACRPCHPAIARSFLETSMGRSFYRPTADKVGAGLLGNNSYYHAASNRHYAVIERDGRYYQRRHQLDGNGIEVNVVEKEIHYVMGSGNHARTYVHRTPRGTLLELPLGWYSEGGGKWAMSPGYDRPNHEDFRREISYRCIACHNAYPAVADEGRREEPPVYRDGLPEGIDCQRCHGAGDEHTRRARSGESLEAVRAAIVNPSRLDSTRALEVCMQCHLQSMVDLPHSVSMPNRGPFGFRPGDAPGAQAIHFEPKDGTAKTRFEIDSAGYRMLQSECYRGSAGKLMCTTCHNPHQAVRGEEAVRHYTQACLRCHSQRMAETELRQRHPRATECVSCHMPKRRAEDVVHVVMTDHAIPRRPPPGDLLAALTERQHDPYRGELVPYYPSVLPASDEVRLTVALAQVIEGTNTEMGIVQLKAAIEAMANPPPKAWFELARAHHRLREYGEAARWFRTAVEKDPHNATVRVAFARSLLESGEARAAIEQLRRARALEPDNPRTLADLGAALAVIKEFAEAAAVLEQAIKLDADIPVAHNSLGTAWLGLGSNNEAMAAYREAIRVRPDYAHAHVNLGITLAETKRLREARTSFEEALRHDPRSWGAHHNFGLLLLELRETEAAASHFQKAIESNPAAHSSRVYLASHLLSKRRYAEAQTQLEAALAGNPELPQAHLYLGVALLAQGKTQAAKEHLKKAASSEETAVKHEAEERLRGLP